MPSRLSMRFRRRFGGGVPGAEAFDEAPLSALLAKLTSLPAALPALRPLELRLGSCGQHGVNRSIQQLDMATTQP